jgi:Rrf2 family protein
VTVGSQVEWALHCVVVLAMLPEGAAISSKDLAEFHGIPKEYLSKALQSLSRAGIVHTTTGPQGGYSLKKSSETLSFLDVVEAIEGSESTFQCSEIRKNNPCLGKTKEKFSPVCEIAAVMYAADASWRSVLRSRKISEIAKVLPKRMSPELLSATKQWFEEP